MPQELPDREIDREIARREAEEESDEGGSEEAGAEGPAGRYVWEKIERNRFLHRARKQLRPRDVMECSCRPPPHGSGCAGGDCFNRVVFVECVPKYCPCGEACGNQCFSKREYVRMELFRAGKKGYGIQAKEHVAPGRFVIEYIGEVINEEKYSERKAAYQADGRKHFYFMSLSNGEYLDAYKRGNMARFFNHSCDPNCEIQKWQVGGELCIGFFSIKEIQPGEELTFDYNFERFSQQETPMKCYCGSANCRGIVGGRQEIVTGEVEDIEVEELEPVMVEAEPEVEVVGPPKAASKRAAAAKGAQGGVARKHSGSTAVRFSEVQYTLREVCNAAMEVIDPAGVLTVIRMFNLCSDGGLGTRDVSLILDSILNSHGKILIEFINCRILRQIQKLMVDMKDADRSQVPIQRKLFSVLEHLPLQPRYMAETKNGQETFVETLRAYLYNNDQDIRFKTKAFLDKWFPKGQRWASDYPPQAGNGGGPYKEGAFGQRPAYEPPQRLQELPPHAHPQATRDAPPRVLSQIRAGSWDRSAYAAIHGSGLRDAQRPRNGDSALMRREPAPDFPRPPSEHAPGREPGHAGNGFAGDGGAPPERKRRRFVTARAPGDGGGAAAGPPHLRKAEAEVAGPPHFRQPVAAGGGGASRPRFGAAPPPPPQPQPTPLVDGTEPEGTTAGGDNKDTWDSANSHLKEAVLEFVRFRLYKYVNDKEHPKHIPRAKADILSPKLTAKIMSKETLAFEKKGRGYVLVRAELEERIKKYIKEHMHKNYLRYRVKADEKEGHNGA